MELLGEDPAAIASYQFTSVEVKEKAFRFDGVFLPQSEDKTIWFVEVQFQKVHEFYSQLFSEIFLFLQQYRPVQDWGVLVLFPDQQTEPDLGRHYRELQGRVRAIYLNELEAGTSVILGLVKLVVTPETEVIKAAQALVAMGQGVDGLLEFVETILIYKLKTLSREEIERMFTLGDLRQTKVYQEAKQEGRQEGRQEGEQRGKREVLQRLLTCTFGRVPDGIRTKLAQLSLEQLGEIAEAIIAPSSLEELGHLLGCNNPSQSNTYATLVTKTLLASFETRLSNKLGCGEVKLADGLGEVLGLDFQVALQDIQTAVPTDFLDDPEGHPRRTQSRQAGAPETVGAGTGDVGLRQGMAENPVVTAGVEVPPGMPAGGKHIECPRLVLRQQCRQVGVNGDLPGRHLPLGIPLAYRQHRQRMPVLPVICIGIGSEQRTDFADATAREQTNGRHRPVAHRRQCPQELGYLRRGENFGFAVTVLFHR